MKVSAIETIRLEEFPNLLFVQVHTDSGYTGLGETFYGAATVEQHIHDAVAPYLLGRDALQLEAHNKELSGYVGYTGSGAETRARSAIDMALWDILGQASGQPLYNLLGGLTRESVRIYNTCAGPRYVRAPEGQAVTNWGVAPGQYEDLHATFHSPDVLAEELLGAGITAMKIWPFDPYAEAAGGTRITAREIERACEPLRRIRKAVGHEIDIMVELHALWDVPSARHILRGLEEFEPFWVEDPVRSDVVNGLATVAGGTPLRIAAGETLGDPGAFHTLLGQGALGVVTVDLTWVGGLTQARKVATAAAAYGVPIAPHDCTGPVALTACTHLSAAAPNALLQETVRAAYLGWYTDLVTDLPAIRDGHITPPSRPGLGTALQPDVRSRHGAAVRVSR